MDKPIFTPDIQQDLDNLFKYINHVTKSKYPNDEPDYKNEVFEVMGGFYDADCDCGAAEDFRARHDERCIFERPNFHHFATDTKFWWLERVLGYRWDAKSTKVPGPEWVKIFEECVESVK